MVKTPLISVGLPVCNAGSYIKDAIESVLAQTFDDFELIISDNASTDCTNDICRAYAGKDRRVRFFVNEQNCGIAENYNRVFGLATGKYFHWMGGDDSHDPLFLERCVAALEAHPGHVLCYSTVKVIDAHGDELCVVDNAMLGTTSPCTAKRLRTVMFEDPFCHTVFSLFRTATLRTTDLIGNFHNSDRVLVAQAALQGPFLHIPEALFFNRDHPDRYSNRPELWHCGYYGMSKKDHVALPHWRTYTEYVGAVRRFVKEPRERRECYRELAKWWLRGSSWKDMTLDVMTFVAPTLVAGTRALKRRFFGAHDPFGQKRGGGRSGESFRRIDRLR
jgi:glycosyltransferase involved in cell wall biosynthesis